jgi:hypothetical protein
MRAVWDAPSSQSSNSAGMPRGVGKNKSAPWSDRFRTVQSIAQRRLLKTTRAPLRVRLRGGGRLRSSFSSTMTTTGKNGATHQREQNDEAPAKVGLTGASVPKESDRRERPLHSTISQPRPCRRGFVIRGLIMWRGFGLADSVRMSGCRYSDFSLNPRGLQTRPASPHPSWVVSVAHEGSVSGHVICDHVLAENEARRIASNIAKLPELARRSVTASRQRSGPGQ